MESIEHSIILNYETFLNFKTVKKKIVNVFVQNKTYNDKGIFALLKITLQIITPSIHSIIHQFS